MTPPIDILSTVTNAYRRLWAERFYVTRLGVVPWVVIFINLILVEVLVEDATLLRRSLYMLPSMIAEAWIVVQFLRTILTNERWPMPRPAAITPALIERARAMLAGLLFYLLISLGTNAFGGILAMTLPTPGPQDTTMSVDPADQTLMLGILAFFVILIFNFRLLWLHVPLIAGLSIPRYLAATKPLVINFQLMAVWFTSLMPAFLILVILSPLSSLSNGDDILAFLAFLALSAISSAAQIVMMLAVSSAIAIALAPSLFTGGQHGR
jgi:hypothetical protein